MEYVIGHNSNGVLASVYQLVFRIGESWFVALTMTDFTYGCQSWTIKKAEHQRIDAFELWCWRRLLRVPWAARRSNQSILKEINSEYSLEGLMVKPKLQYFGHLMQRADSLEKTLMMGKIAGRKRRGRRRKRWLDGVSPTHTWVWASSRSWWRTGKPGVLQSMGLQRVRHNWATELSWMKKTDNIQCWQGHNESRTLLYCWLKYKMLGLPWKAASWFFKKIEFAHAIWCSNSTPRYLPQRNENMSTQRFLYTYS